MIDIWGRAAAYDDECNAVARELGLPDVSFSSPFTPRPRLPRRSRTTERREAIARLVRQHAASRVVPWIKGEIEDERFCFAVPRDHLVYFIESAGLIKIGTTNNMEHRLKSLRAMSAVPMELLAVIDGGLSVERALHAHFAEHRAHGEWFRPAHPIVDLIDFIIASSEADASEAVVA